MIRCWWVLRRVIRPAVARPRPVVAAAVVRRARPRARLVLVCAGGTGAAGVAGIAALPAGPIPPAPEPIPTWAAERIAAAEYVAPTPVPEPGAITLFLAGLLVLCVVRAARPRLHLLSHVHSMPETSR